MLKMNHICFKCKSIIIIDIDENFFKGKTIFCPNNHEIFIYPQSPKYTFLFQQSLDACSKGYYAEAFQTLYAGFEAFKTYFVESIFCAQTRDITLTLNIMKKINRSEKIDGAFTISYAKLLGSLPKEMPDTLVKKRNKVIHTGTIPESSDVLKLGNWIFCFVNEIHNIMFKFKIGDIFNPILDYEMKKSVIVAENNGYKLADIGDRFQSIQIATTAINPNGPIKDKKDLYEFFLSDEFFQTAFNQIFFV